jgi:hypothetical protein
MRGKSNVIKTNVEKVWGARYLPKNTVNDREICSISSTRNYVQQIKTTSLNLFAAIHFIPSVMAILVTSRNLLSISLN